MRVRSLSHLSNKSLLSELEKAEARDRSGTVELLGFLAEVDRRKLYVPAGYPSMFVWCVEARHYSEAMASRRIAAARAARRFPAILDMVADGRLHLSAVALLSSKLTSRNAGELLAAATHRSRRQIERMIAERFPEPDVATRLQALVADNSLPSPVTVNVCAAAPSGSASPPARSVAAPAQSSVTTSMALAPAGAPAAALAPHPRVAPLAPERYAVQFTMDQAMHDDLVRAQELLGHVVVPGGITEVFRRALRELVTKLERQKFAVTARPKAKPRAAAKSSNPRHVPAAIKREVRARDEGRCTFVSDTGHRCGSRDALEYDHIVPVARGGKSTLENVRLLCRAHNQHAADQAFGEGFMHAIRERARTTMGPPGTPVRAAAS